MDFPLSHDEFLGTYYERAWKTAEITIADVVKKNGPIHPAIDVESVKAEGALAGLERTFENFDAAHPSGAKVTTLLDRIVWNCVLSELGRATTEAKRAGLISQQPRKKGDDRKYRSLVPGIAQRQNTAGPVEEHRYIEVEGWQERKEELLNLMCRYLKRLPVNDQVILNHWAKDEKTYVERALAELGLEHTSANANWVYVRKNRALKTLAKLMGGQKPDYRDIALPSAGINTNSFVYSDRNALRRHQYAAKMHVTRNINYSETVALLAEKIVMPL